MLSALPFSFSAPLALAALALLPALWLILRVTPPRPRRIDFPPLKIMADLIAKRETPAHTPWWLLALRMAVAALAILAVAGPVWNPVRDAAPSRGPVLLLIDNGFGAATDWPERVSVAESRMPPRPAKAARSPWSAWPRPPPPSLWQNRASRSTVCALSRSSRMHRTAPPISRASRPSCRARPPPRSSGSRMDSGSPTMAASSRD